MELLTIALVILSAFLIVFSVTKHKEADIAKKNYDRIKARFRPAAELEEEIEKSKANFEKLEKELNKKLSSLQSNYAKKKRIYDDLAQQVHIFEEKLELIDFGVYEPRFELTDSEAYKAKIRKIKDKQNRMMKDKQACVCTSAWHVEGSRKKGEKMTNEQIKLMLRAFNNECESAILSVKWNNVRKMEERINRAFNAINKLGESSHIHMTVEFLNAKLYELNLTYGKRQKLHEEKEEQRYIRESMREEEKVRKEIEQAMKKAEKEEQLYQKALDEARRELEAAGDVGREVLGAKIAELETQLADAHQQSERACSQAQLTKSGHVYVISNVGAFGEDVYKIGMTRRLEPMDRVKELGDASVPFEFDVHAMIYAENAPEVERILHEKLDAHRVNLVNRRKEFFNVSIDDIAKQVEACGFNMELTKYAEAQQYRESLALREQRSGKMEAEAQGLAAFPATI